MRVTPLGLFLAAVAAVTVAAPAEAQLGGLMRRAREAVKDPTTEKDPKAAEPATSSGRNPFADPAVVFITQDQLGRFEKALRYEVAQRDELRKSLVALKTPEEYQACSLDAMMSPEFMQIAEGLASKDPNASAEQLLKTAQKMQADMAAMVTKRCGADPAQGAGRRMERMRQIELEASDIAMPPGWTPPPGSVARLERGMYAERAALLIDTRGAGRTPVALSYRAPHPFYLAAAAGAAAGAQMPNPHPFARAYAMLKERIPVFCAKLDAKAPLPSTSMTIGSEKVLVVKIPGQGSAEYVYRQDEADALTKQCSVVMGQLDSLFKTQ